ncbi:hypothetical protein SK128_003356 [Halocaridina rubra]|uniref:G-protein coupled receptors family 2 profile 2 domain-containing protein n=1 Tax=Halocaridina rubra TaxID=373956 RepID=A0AAN9AGY2_HALRR
MCQLCVAPLRDLHGLCMAAYMGALLSADASLFTIKLYAGELTPSACIGVGMTVYVSFLSTFMWLNVICFDIWKYVGQTVQAVPLYQSPRDFRWFLAYGGYAWGVPFIIGLVVGGLQGHNPRHELTLMPHFALHNCWFEASEFWGTLLFFYGPIGILLSVNTVFIVHTGLRLYSLHHSCCFRTSHQRDQQSQHRPHLNEAMTDTINAFQGVFIFFIFLKSSKKRRLVKHSVKKLLSTLRQESSSSWRSLGFTQSKPEHLINHLRHTTPNSKAFSHIFSKEKLSNMSSCENIIHDEDSKDDDVGREANSSWLFDGNNGSSVWTTQWKSFRSDFYFPATGETSADILGNSEDLFFKSSCNLQSICSPYSEGSDTENKPEVILQPERSSFPSWNFMRSRSGSITLRQERNLKGSDEDVVCQKLERKDNLGYI